jgi:hypothetical protein
VRPWGSLLHEDFSHLADLVLTKLTVSGADAHGERGRGLAALVRGYSWGLPALRRTRTAYTTACSQLTYSVVLSFHRI